MKAYSCTLERFEDLGEFRGMDEALSNLNNEPCRLGDEYDTILVHEGMACSVVEEKDKRKRLIKPKRAGHSTSPKAKMPETTNQDFASKDKRFIWVCGILGISASARQASKWRNGKGAAFAGREKAIVMNKLRIAETKLEQCQVGYQKCVLCETALMDDRTQTRLDAEKATRMAEDAVIAAKQRVEMLKAKLS